MNQRVEATSGAGIGRLRLGAVLAVAVAIGFIAWLFLKGDDNGSQSKATAAPVAASEVKLRALPGKYGHTVYWTGTKRGYTYELTEASDGDIYIRYLPPGVGVGDQQPSYTTIGTYPHPNAFGTVQKAAKRPGETVLRLPGGGLAVSNKSIPRSIYFAYPHTDYLIEVYDRSPERARKLVTSGRVRPIR